MHMLVPVNLKRFKNGLVSMIGFSEPLYILAHHFLNSQIILFLIYHVNINCMTDCICAGFQLEIRNSKLKIVLPHPQSRHPPEIYDQLPYEETRCGAKQPRLRVAAVIYEDRRHGPYHKYPA